MSLVMPGDVFERVFGPPLRVKVVTIGREVAQCRMGYEDGQRFGGLRPVPLDLLLSDQFRVLADHLTSPEEER